MRAILLLLVVLAGWPARTAAHPVPLTQIHRTLDVQLTPQAVVVDYTMEIDTTILNWTLNQFDDVDPASILTLDAMRKVFVARVGPIVAEQLFASLDQKRLSFTLKQERFESRPDEHTACVYRFEAAWAPALGETHTFNFEEITQFETVKPGLRPGEVQLRFVEPIGITILKREVPGTPKPRLERTPEEDARLRQLSATFQVVNPEAVAPKVTAPAPTSLTSTSLWDRLQSEGLGALFDSGYGLGVLLMIAGIFGAAHALTPGHGKTMVAAYLVGERGTPWHAVVLGVITTMTHTGSVILIALILWVLYPDTVPRDVQTILGFVGGLLIAGLGVWLLLRRIAGQADHVHLFDDGHHHHGPGHHHHHHHEHPPIPAGKPGDRFGWTRLVLLGISGGIIPCWDAVALLGIAITANRLWLGVPLLLAFSAGLALVLVAIGLAVVYAKRVGGRQFGEKRWFRLLPIVSALLLIGIGLWLCKDSLIDRNVTEADAAAKPRSGVVAMKSS